jgi:hypothetical protein
VNDAERFLWFWLGAATACVGIRFWATHHQTLINAAGGMVGKCQRCKRSYTFRHPSMWRTARRYHDEYVCEAREERDGT